MAKTSIKNNTAKSNIKKVPEKKTGTKKKIVEDESDAEDIEDVEDPKKNKNTKKNGSKAVPKTTKSTVGIKKGSKKLVIEEEEDDSEGEQEKPVTKKNVGRGTKQVQKKGSKKIPKSYDNESEDDDDDKNVKKGDQKKKKDDKILYVKIPQTGAFKQVIERIAGSVSDCCIVFVKPDEQTDEDDDYYEEIDEDVPKKKTKTEKGTKAKKEKGIKAETTKRNAGGIRILRLTEDKNILLKLNLDAANFETFRCEEPKITIGVDMHNLHGLLKTINDDDSIVMYMNRNNRSSLYIRCINESENQNQEETDIEVFLMEIGNTEMNVPQTKFQGKITIGSDKFHSICKNLNNNSTTVEITSVGDEIKFRGQSDGGKITKSYRDSSTGAKKKSDLVYQGVFELRNLMGFSKCNKLCNNIDIYLKNDFPLVLAISVATLGKLYVFLTPLEDYGDN